MTLVTDAMLSGLLISCPNIRSMKNLVFRDGIYRDCHMWLTQRNLRAITDEMACR
jgi:hypothetical protein